VRRLYRAVGLIVLVILIAFAYQRIFGDRAAAPHLVSSRPVAVIGGEADEAVAVAEDGTVLTWLSLPDDLDLPQLPLDSPPQGTRVKGPSLEQVRVLAAAPPALFPYVESTYFGDSGIDVILTSGIELRFGGSVGAERKWRAAAAVLANPELTSLDSVDLHAPGRPAVDGSGHTLPPIP
jgi:hypothetical protein